MTSKEIRAQFIDFFVHKHGHTFVPSSPVVPVDDPSLLFTNAGMNQFKPIFLGQEKRAYTRVANSQKCIRAGGKHNDLDDVGRSRRHHTFFEMLGNWSFGDYFKRGAIEMAWELLTQVWKLDPTRLHVSCYEGNESAGIPRDTEAADLWKQIAGMPDDHIHYFGKDNFWEMGETGPCGPCTEIYIDRTPDKTGGPQVNGDDPRVMEIWNLVFIQYNRDATGKLTTLPAQHVDTGMGFERISQVIQGKDDNYAIDLWTPVFDAIKTLSGLSYTGQFPKTNAPDPAAEAANPQLRHDIAFRVVADHVRCLTFALTDGATPSNEGRGYVLRRILRRAVRFGRQQLNLNEPFLHKLVLVIVESMGEAFPELRKNPQHVIELVKDEEVSFGNTVERGITLFEMFAADAIGRAYVKHFFPTCIYTGTLPSSYLDSEKLGEDKAYRRGAKGFGFLDKVSGILHQRDTDSALAELKNHGLSVEIPADGAFKLYDTYGFPPDLTRIMAEERGISVDTVGYDKLMDKAKELARAGGKQGEDTGVFDLPPDAIAKLQGEKIPPTNDNAKYQQDDITATVRAIWDGMRFVNEVPGRGSTEQPGAQGMFAVILDHTNFYAEMGGQVGDQGELRGGGIGTTKGGGANFIVKSTHAVGGYVLHIGFCVAGPLRVDTMVDAHVGTGYRNTTEKNHTTTHIANWALREVLGDNVQQKGSLVDPEKLRFDFSHGKAMTDEEIGKVESLVNAAIGKRLPVYAQVAPQEQALKIHGLRAVFGEKYPPMVRVVSVGVPVHELLADPTNAKWRQYSIEFCGGTHLKSSDEAEKFAVIAEESVSKGIRRLVALTGAAAELAVDAETSADKLIAQSRAAGDAELQPLIASLQKAAAGNLPLRGKRRVQAAVVELQSRHKAWEKANRSEKSEGAIDATAIAADLLANATPLGGGKLIIGEIPGAGEDQLRSAMDSLKKKAVSYGIMIASAGEGKVNFVAAVSDDMIAKGLKAGDWVRETAKVAGGGGGGRPQMAQAGGKDPGKLGEALKRAREFAEGMVR